MGSTEHSTEAALDDLLDLLRGKNPDSKQALQQVNAILEQEPCVQELQAASDAAAEIVEQLLLPVLSEDSVRLERAEMLQKSWRSDPFTADEQQRQVEQEALLKEMGEWVIDCSVAESDVAGGGLDGKAVSLPRTLFARLASVMTLVCESEVELVQQVEQWQAQTEVPWEEIGAALQNIEATGHRAAVLPWMRQRRAFYDALQSVVEVSEKGGVSQEKAKGSALLGKRPQLGGRVEAHRIQGLLHSRITALHQEARSLKSQQEDSRERAEQLKERLDQLELDLTQARRDQFLDPATGIPDRFAFSAYLQRHLDRAVHLSEVFALLLLHFYNLQPLLNTLGNIEATAQGSAEERLMRALAEEVRQHLPEGAYLARLSAERFVVLLPERSQEEGEQVGVVIRDALEAVRFSLDNQELAVEVHCGCAAYQSGMTGGQMLDVTDRLAAVTHAEKEARSQEAQQVRTC